MSITRTRYRMQTTLTYLSTRLAQVKRELEILRAGKGSAEGEGGGLQAPAAVRWALKRLRAQRDAAGNQVAVDERIRQLEAELTALEETIRQFDPELDPSVIAAGTGRPS